MREILHVWQMKLLGTKAPFLHLQNLLKIQLWRNIRQEAQTIGIISSEVAKALVYWTSAFFYTFSDTFQDKLKSPK